VKGRPPLSGTFPTRREAQRWAASLESAIREQRYDPSAEGKRRTLEEAVARYRAEIVPSLKAGRDRELQLAWWCRYLGGHRLNELSPALIAEYRDKLPKETVTREKNGKSVKETITRSGATVNRYIAALSALLTVTQKQWHWTNDNVVRRVGRKSEPRGRTRWLSDEERERLLAACERSTWDGLYPAVMLALTTGGRRHEVIGLQWDQIDLKAGRAFIADSKNGESRVLPVVGPALKALKAHAKVRTLRCPWVFPNRRGDAPWWNFDRFWQTALTEAKIEGFRFHDLRHTAASYLAMNGATLGEIADVLGHRTLAMVKRYSHFADEHRQQVVGDMVTARFSK
jgi:integrase